MDKYFLKIHTFCLGTKDIQNPTVDGHAVQGSTNLESTVHHAVSDTERLWAYLTIKQLLENEQTLHDKDLKKKVVDLALKYSFVTPVSSLVVVKPDDTVTFDIDVPQGTYNKGYFT